MSVYARWATALEKKDLEAAMACVAEDYTFVRHQSGTTLDKSGLAGMLKAMMASDDVHFRDRRCITKTTRSWSSMWWSTLPTAAVKLCSR